MREGSYHSRNVLQHDRDRKDGSRCHRQVEATTSISQSQHQANEVLYFNNQTGWQNRSTFAEWLRHSMPRCTGGECFSCWTTRRVTMAPLNATMSSWHSYRQIYQHTCNRSTQVSLNGCSLDQQFLTCFFLIGIIRAFKARYRKKFVRWLLDAIHTRIDRKFNIL